MSDEDLRRLVKEDLEALSASKSSSHFWTSLADVLDESGDNASPEEELLKVLVGQSKVLIRQNELILRNLRRALPQNEPDTVLSNAETTSS